MIDKRAAEEALLICPFEADSCGQGIEVKLDAERPVGKRLNVRSVRERKDEDFA